MHRGLVPPKHRPIAGGGWGWVGRPPLIRQKRSNFSRFHWPKVHNPQKDPPPPHLFKNPGYGPVCLRYCFERIVLNETCALCHMNLQSSPQVPNLYLLKVTEWAKPFASSQMMKSNGPIYHDVYICITCNCIEMCM